MSRFITTENTEITETSLCALWSLERDLKKRGVAMSRFITTENTEITETSLCALWSLERDLKSAGLL